MTSALQSIGHEPPATMVCVDLFCGGGGITEGLEEAAADLKVDLIVHAINHWGVAVDTHRRNHPRVKQYCESIEGVDPREVVPGGIVDFLLLAPECVHFSRARGGKPMSPQSRAGIYHTLRWCDSLYVRNILIENVREIQDWGPLHPCTCDLGPTHDKKHPRPCLFATPIKEKKGLLFRRFVGDLRARGYKVEYRVLNAAHYGDATTRHRFFLQATLEDRAITWPTQTHFAPNELPLFHHAKPWRTAREIIDWSLQGKSIYGRKTPLVFNTHRRIFAGLHKFSGLPKVPFEQGEPIPLFLIRPEDAWRIASFLVGAGGTTGQQRPQSADQPLGTVLPGDRRALVGPYLTEYHGRKGSEERVRDLCGPIPTVDTSNRFGLVEGSFLLPVTHAGGADRCSSPDRPLGTVTGAHRGEIALAQPMLLPHQHGSDGPDNVRSVDRPMPVITGSSSDIFLAESFLVPNFGEREDQAPRTHGVDAPLPTVTSHGAGALVRPYLVKFYGGHTAADVDDPLGTVTASYEHYGIADPCLVVFRNNMDGASPDKPLGTICTSAAHFGLARPLLINYNGTGVPHSVEKPVPTIPTHDRFGLVEPVLSEMMEAEHLLMLDILFRMLQPHELAAAHSFPQAYHFCGNRDDQVRQIGNSVPIQLGRALCLCVLGPRASQSTPSTQTTEAVA